MIYLVNQGITWEQERAGGFLWSPKYNRKGHKNAGYELMKKVKKYFINSTRIAFSGWKHLDWCYHSMS